MKSRLNDKSTIQRKLFSDTYLVALIEELACIGAGFIDGLVISVFLGGEAIAAEGIIHPFFSAVGIITGSMLLGTQKMCVNHLCKGDKKQAEEIFNTAFFTSLFASLLVTAVCFLFAGPIVTFLGARGTSQNLYLPARQYLRGLSIGAPTLVLVPVLTPIAQMEGKKKHVKLSLAAIAGFDVLFDILSALLGFGMLGMGLSTSIAQIIGFAILWIPMMKDSLMEVSIRKVQMAHLSKILREGMPKIIRRLCNLVKPITINVLILSIAGSKAMSAMSIRNNVSNFTECTGAALGATVLLLTSMMVGEQNNTALDRMRNRALLCIKNPIFPLSALIFAFAGRIATIYVHGDAEILRYAAMAIRCLAVDLVFIAIMEMLNNYWQGIGRTQDINLIVVLQKFVYPLICVFVLGKLFGVKGVWISYPLSTFLAILSFGVITKIKKVSSSGSALFPMPASCVINDDKKLEYVITGKEAVSERAEYIQNFCCENGIDARRSMFVALCFEEMVSNIIEHGFEENKTDNSIDVYLAIYNNDVTLRIRDNCKKFDAVSKYKTFTFDPENPEKCVGIRMVMKMAKNVSYVNVFGMNNLIITI